MATTKEVLLTTEGLEEIKKELEELKTVKRPAVIEALKEARSLGDLSENAEYDSARTEQALVEAKIQELEYMLENAVIIEEVNTDEVCVGTKIKLEYIEDGDTDLYFMVGSAEADPFTNKISNESPIAKAILGKKCGEIVTVDSPQGKYDVKIVEIG